MEAISTQKFVKMGPRKLRLVADSVRSLTPEKALEVLPFIRKRGAENISKAIKTAVANARVKGMNESNLIFKTLEINEGPRLKRFIAVSRGRAHNYVKQMSHIRIVLTEKEVKAMPEIKKAEEPKTEVKKTKKVVKNTKKTVVSKEK